MYTCDHKYIYYKIVSSICIIKSMKYDSRLMYYRKKEFILVINFY